MAVKIERYRQRTATPQGQVSGGSPVAVGGPDLGGALLDLASGISGAVRSREQARKEQEDSVAAAYSSESLANLQRDGARELMKYKQEAGEDGAGVSDRINVWYEQRIEQAIAAAPNEAARSYIRDRGLEFRNRLDLSAFEFEVEGRQRYISDAVDRGTESAAAAAAAFPGFAEQAAAVQRAAIMATNLSPDVKRAKVQALVDSVAVADVIARGERDPYALKRELLSRFGLGAETTREEMFMAEDSAVKALTEIQEREGVQVPVELQQQAAATLMSGGTISRDKATGEWMFSPRESGDGDWSVRSLSVPKAWEMLQRVDAEIARRENKARQEAEYGKLLFAQRLRDIQATLASGEPTSLPSDAEMNFFLGPERAALEKTKLVTMQSMAGDLAAMDGLTNAEIIASVAVPPTGPENGEWRRQAYQIKAQRAAAIIKAREDDPGQYVLSNSTPVNMAYRAYVEAEQQFRQAALTGQGTSIDQVIDAQTQYLSVLQAEQRRLGILDPKLPNAHVEAWADSFERGLKSDNPQLAAAQLEAMAATMSSSPEAVMQIVAKTSDFGAFAVDGVDGLVIKRLMAGREVPEDKRKQLLPLDMPVSGIKAAVAQWFAPMTATFAAMGDDATAARYVNAGNTLAMEHLIAGRASSPTEAARMAYAELFAEKNEVVGTYRISKAEDIPAVQAGLADYLATLSPTELQVAVEPGMTAEETGARLLRTLRASAFWVNNQSGDGVFLMWAGGPVKRADGKPLEILFDEAAQRGLLAPKPQPQPPRTPGAVGAIR